MSGAVTRDAIRGRGYRTLAMRRAALRPVEDSMMDQSIVNGSYTYSVIDEGLYPS